MTSILPFVRRTGIAFDDRATEAVGKAFDAACEALHDASQPQIVYELIAKRIIDAARNGERDVARLRDAGLAALGLRCEERTSKLSLDREMKKPNLEGRLSAYECKALKLLSAETTDFLVWGYFVGVGRPTLDSLVKRGLAETGPSRTYPSDIGWRITDDGWRCMYGETIAETLAKPNGAKTRPFAIWKWPVDPAGPRLIN